MKFVRLSDRPLVGRIVALSVGISLLMAVGVTAIGYSNASRGLNDQGEARLASDAYVLTSALDRWNLERLEATHALANVKALGRALDMGSAHTPEDEANVNDAISAVQRGLSDIQAVTIINGDGLAVFATSPVSLGANLKNRDYFQAAIHGGDFISGVSISLTDGAQSIFRATPVRTEDGRVVGVVQLRSNPASIQKMLEAEKARIGDEQKGVLLDESGLVVASSVDPSWLLRPVVPLPADVLAAMGRDKRWGNAPTPDPLGQSDLATAIGVSSKTSFAWHTQGLEYHAVALPLQATHWTYVAALPAASFNAAALDLLRTSALAVVVGLLLATAAAVLLTRPVATALRRLTSTAYALALGDAQHEIVADSRDEVGQVALAFERIQAYQRALTEVAASMADGDLTAQVAPASERDQLGIAFEDMQSRLGGLVRQVQAAAVDLAGSAQCVGTVAEQTSDAVQQVSLAIQSLTVSAQDANSSANRSSAAIAELAEAAEAIAQGASEQAEQVRSASHTVRSIVSRVEGVAASAEAVASNTHRTLDAAQRLGRHVAADHQEVAAELLHDVELAFGAGKDALALAVRHALEVAERLQGDDIEAELAAGVAHVGRRAAEGHEIVLEDLHGVELGGRDGFQFLAQGATQRYRRDRGLHESSFGRFIPLDAPPRRRRYASCARCPVSFR